MNQQEYISGLMSRCYEAGEAGDWPEEKVRALLDEAAAFEKMPVVGSQVMQAIHKRNFNMLAGALGMCLLATNQASEVSVNNVNDNRLSAKSKSESTATANAVASYSGAVAAVEGLAIDEAAKSELVGLLVEVRKAKVKDDDGLVRQAIKSLLDSAIDHGFDAFAAVAPYAVGVAKACLGVA